MKRWTAPLMAFLLSACATVNPPPLDKKSPAVDSPTIVWTQDAAIQAADMEDGVNYCAKAEKTRYDPGGPVRIPGVGAWRSLWRITGLYSAAEIARRVTDGQKPALCAGFQGLAVKGKLTNEVLVTLLNKLPHLSFVASISQVLLTHSGDRWVVGNGAVRTYKEKR
jgi:hypothetical protein